jgi:membrane-associated phospholipid phosphatase
MPWLYGLAALTGLARIQQRQHWFSDTVAGGAMGYAIATALTYQRERQARYGEAKPGEPTFMVSPNRIDVAWAFR